MAAGAKNMKRFGGELGGKTPILLFDDADLDKALPKVEKALTVFAGQFCMTGSRLLVHRPILDAVRKRLAARLEAVKVGPASDPSSDMGPMINIANVKRVDGVVGAAIAAGAKVVVRGGPFKDGPLAKGAFYRPALLEISDHSMSIAQEEVFGPVLVMQAFRHRRRSCRSRQRLSVRPRRVDLVQGRRPPAPDSATDRGWHGLDQ